ncbi:IclR family transcriptional regulator domain-containing protein [Amycolatopsis nivea]|uniref:IclR family transcriptional regulator domain-containing protein n=1 Tax=Amycolatopsis nivea TaxID=1644109 RepID=UPI001F0DD793|nr:redoxin domain-containing protein [Amycolatopsis nivea]
MTTETPTVPGTAAAEGDATARIVPSVAKAVRVLETLAESREPLGLADLARRLALPKSTVKTLCTTLVQTRMARRVQSGSYELGPHVVDLSRAYLAKIELTTEFARICDAVPELAVHTLALSVLDGRDVVYVARRPGRQPLGLDYRLGMRFPATCAAGGKALLSHLSTDEVDRLFPGPELPTLTPHSITTVDALHDELGRTRCFGYAVDDEESATGLYSFGAAVADFDGDGASAAITASAPKGALGPPANLAPERVVELARLLSERMGGPASPRGLAGQVRIWGRAAVRVGDRLPALTLPSTSGRLVDLGAVARDRPVVLFFYPGDREGLRYPELAGCTTQARAFRDCAGAIASFGAELFGVSLQSTPRQREFIDREQLPFELLSDQGRELVGALGIPLWMSRLGEDYPARTTLVVGRGGSVTAVLENVPAQGHAAGALNALEDG